MKKITFALCVALAICGCKKDKTITVTPQEALKTAVAEGKFLYGHQDDLVYGKNWHVTADSVLVDKIERSDVYSVVGAYPAMVGFDLGGIEKDDKENLDGVPFALIRRAAVAHYGRGGVVTLSWHPRNPVTGGDSWDISDSTVVASVLEGGANHELFIGWLDKVADFISSMVDPKGNKIPVIFRPWHENVSTWFWWGGKLCTPDQYKALYQMTYKHLNDRGLTNMMWAYSPDSNASAEAYFERYPGDEYVDILATDCYEYVNWDDASKSDEEKIAEGNAYYGETLARVLGYMNDYASSHGKYIAISETGFESIPYERWWTDVLLPAVKDFPVSYILTWRNAWDKPSHYYAPFTGSVDAKNFVKFYTDDKTKFLESK